MSLRSNYTPVAKVKSLLDEKNNFSLRTFKNLKSIYENTKLTHREIDFLREIGLLKKSSESKLYKFTLTHLYVGYALNLYKDNKSSNIEEKITLNEIRNTLIDVNYDSGQYIDIGRSKNEVKNLETIKKEVNSAKDLNIIEKLWKSIKNIFQ